ncbi:O-acetyl-ADP-ribose deacetylase [Plakobranchus ocellatus]|uniref:O-acetyl-ADP-ribose deacetylase n=1 Tax=Plakobranchus ocellatus TaxID=259542 RepID=A0AAV4E092_9GAST|nr:O-acetyl-ADP-ribose deacetylase [Plakobranchus ocellatus]
MECLFRDEKISSSVVRYKTKQQLSAENVASVVGSSLIKKKTHGIDPEQEVQRSNLGAERGVGMDSFVVPPRKKLSEDLVTRNSGIKVKVLKADITTQRVDAIVSATNPRLTHGGGVAKAIADKAGPDLVQECSRFTKGENQVGVTELFVSSGGKLPAKHVIHAVGPNWRAYKEERKEECARDLRRTVLNCLLEAAARGCRSIAIPSISAIGSQTAALRQMPDLIVLVGKLFQNLHSSPIVDAEREIKINTDCPSKENIFTILGGKKSFPLVVQFHLDKYDQENLDHVFYDVGNYWSIIRPYIKQIQSVVFTCDALYSGGFLACRYPYLVDDKFVGAFTRNVYEFLMKSALHGCNVTIAAGSEAITKVYQVLESK